MCVCFSGSSCLAAVLCVCVFKYCVCLSVVVPLYMAFYEHTSLIGPSHPKRADAHLTTYRCAERKRVVRRTRPPFPLPHPGPPGGPPPAPRRRLVPLVCSATVMLCTCFRTATCFSLSPPPLPPPGSVADMCGSGSTPRCVQVGIRAHGCPVRCHHHPCVGCGPGGLAGTRDGLGRDQQEPAVE